MTKIINYHSDYIGHPMSRADLRHLSEKVKRILNIPLTSLYIDVARVLERISELNPNFNYEIVEDHNFCSNIQGGTNIKDNTIYIKESVYIGACNGNGKDRMTIVHEICHLILHRDLTPIPEFYRRDGKSHQVIIENFRKPEWQAECFATEFLMPYDKIKNMSEAEIVKECHVSYTAAHYQKGHI